MFDLFWVTNFIKIGHIAILRSNMLKFFFSGQDPQFQISYLWLTNLTCSDCQISKHWKFISFLGPNFPGIWILILALMSNLCYLAVILVFLVVTRWLLLVTVQYCSFPFLVWTSRVWLLTIPISHVFTYRSSLIFYISQTLALSLITY